MRMGQPSRRLRGPSTTLASTITPQYARSPHLVVGQVQSNVVAAVYFPAIVAIAERQLERHAELSPTPAPVNDDDLGLLIKDDDAESLGVDLAKLASTCRTSEAWTRRRNSAASPLIIAAASSKESPAALPLAAPGNELVPPQ